MKSIQLYLLSLVLVALVAACGDEHQFLSNVTPVGSGAKIKVFHGASDVPGIVIQVNDKVVSGVLTIAPALPNLLTYGSVFPSQEYALVPAGTAKIKVTAPATATTSEVSLSADASVQDGKFYTIHAIGVAPNYAFLVSEDDLTVPDANKTYIRFLNAMPQTASTGVEFVVNNTVAATETGLSDGKEAFIAYDQPGSTRFTIVLREVGKTAALSTLSNLNFVRGKKYTIIARGIFGTTATTTRPTLGFVNNN